MGKQLAIAIMASFSLFAKISALCAGSIFGIMPTLCSAETHPPTLIVEADCSTAYANSDWYVAAAQLSVYLSQAYPSDLEVTVTPYFEDGYADGDLGDYARFSTTAKTLSSLPAYSAPVVTIPANSTGKQTIFLYALMSDAHTMGEGHQLKFKPSFTDTAAAEVVTETQDGGLWIDAGKPVITTPCSYTEIAAMRGSEIELEVSVEGTYADMRDTATGYAVQFRSTSSASWTTLPERYRVSENGNLVGLSSGSLPKWTFDVAGVFSPQICVISPVSGKTSEPVTFTAHIASPPCVEVTAPEELEETDTNQYVRISVDYWEDSVLTARVEVVEGREGRDNPGALKLDSAYASQLPDEDNVYYVELFEGSADIAIESMDGTDASISWGFIIRASIVSSDVNYVPGQQRVYIENVAPACDVTPENSTPWHVDIGATVTNTIHWQVVSDVAEDFAGTTSCPGIRISFSGCENGETFYVTEPSSGEFTPDFGYMTGSMMVFMEIEDKDWGLQYWTYHYEIGGHSKETVDGITWWYSVVNGGASIENDEEAWEDDYVTVGDVSGDIAIPSTLGGFPVTRIGRYVFSECSGLTSVTIPDTVTNIESGAFYHCSAVEDVYCFANPDVLTWDGADFKSDGTTLIHVKSSRLAAYETKFSSVVNATFVGDLDSLVSERSVTVVAYDENFTDVQCSFNEGDTVNFLISLSEVNDTGGALYAFLLCDNDVDPLVFSGGYGKDSVITNTTVALQNSRGLPISTDQSSVSGSFRILDGGPDVNFTFSVVLCSSSSYDPDNRITSYATGDTMNVSVQNAEPVIRRIEMNGFESAMDGDTFSVVAWKGDSQNFRAVVVDKGSYDLSNNEDGKQFQTKWTCRGNGVSPYSEIVYGNPNEKTFSYAFPSPGSWTVTAEVKDKDMAAWGASYSVGVTVDIQRYTATVGEVVWVYEEYGETEARIVGSQTVLTGNVAIPDAVNGRTVVALAESALRNASGVTGITIPKSVTLIEDGAFSGLEEVLAQWYKSLADLVESGLAYGIGENVADQTIAHLTVEDDTEIGDFVLSSDKVYDSVVYIVNTADRAISIILPEGYAYRKFKGANPLKVPAKSEAVLTITRLADKVFLVSTEELEGVE